jgi:hypothetical protein
VCGNWGSPAAFVSVLSFQFSVFSNAGQTPPGSSGSVNQAEWLTPYLANPFPSPGWPPKAAIPAKETESGHGFALAVQPPSPTRDPSGARPGGVESKLSAVIMSRLFLLWLVVWPELRRLVPAYILDYGFFSIPNCFSASLR